MARTQKAMFRQLRRCLCMLAGASLGWAAIQIAGVSTSGLARLVQFGLVAGGMLLIGLALLSQQKWNGLCESVGKTLEPRTTSDSKRMGVLLMGVAATSYAVIAFTLSSWNINSDNDDEGAYLATAAMVRNDGGVVRFIGDLYRGRFSEANRHPLYIGLLSVSPTFEAGKQLSQLIGLTTLIGLAWQSVNLLGWFRTGILCVLLATNFSFCRFSILVSCEILLSFWMMWLWFLLLRMQQCQPGIHSQQRWLVLSSLSAGLLALMWLTKGTGLLLSAGFAIWLLNQLFRLDQPQGKSDETSLGESQKPAQRSFLQNGLIVCCFGFTWLVIASPLLARNLALYDSAFYNVNTWLLFEDEYEDPLILAQRPISEAAWEYFNMHSAQDILKREFHGLVWESFILTRMLGPAPWDDARVLPGCLILFCAGFGGWTYGGRAAGLLLVWCVLLVVMFAWYVPVAAGERFLFPLLIPIGTLASWGIGHWCNTPHRQKAVTVLAVVGCLCTVFCTCFGGGFAGRF